MRFGPDPGGRRLSRLTKRSQFLAAATGRRFHVATCSVQARPRDPDPHGLRIGFTLTKKTGHATERNRIRRRLRAAARLVAADRVDDPLDVVVVGRRDALSASFPALLDDLARALAGATRPKRPATDPRPRSDGPAGAYPSGFGRPVP